MSETPTIERLELTHSLQDLQDKRSTLNPRPELADEQTRFRVHSPIDLQNIHVVYSNGQNYAGRASIRAYNIYNEPEKAEYDENRESLSWDGLWSKLARPLVDEYMAKKLGTYANADSLIRETLNSLHDPEETPYQSLKREISHINRGLYATPPFVYLFAQRLGGRFKFRRDISPVNRKPLASTLFPIYSQILEKAKNSSRTEAAPNRIDGHILHITQNALLSAAVLRHAQFEQLHKNIPNNLSIASLAINEDSYAHTVELQKELQKLETIRRESMDPKKRKKSRAKVWESTDVDKLIIKRLIGEVK